jgi:curli biogenesis system outer membrane secretion channel CsgG
VYDYEGPEQTKLLKLAIMPLKVLKKDYQFGSYDMPGDQMSAKMAQKLSVGLSGTNKFSVLDREYIQNFMYNRKIMVEADSSVEEKAKLSKVLGADYMIVGTVSDARLDIIERMSSILGVLVREYNADFIFDYRLIVAPTMQVKLADTVNIRLEETNEVRKLVKDWEPENLDYRELADNLVAKAANEVVKTIIDRLYPIRIASINENGQIIINQGGKRISQGLVLDVFSEDKEIFDADTKESLGKTEILVAIIEIAKVAPKISYAKIVKGDLSKISEGLICRRKKIEAKTLEGRKSQIERTPRGGVKLPFD